MHDKDPIDRRDFLQRTLATAGAAGMTAAMADRARAGSADPAGVEPPQAEEAGLPLGAIGKSKISRMLLGGNLISGFMHARDLHYVGPLFRAYVTEEKVFQTFKIAEENGINTVFETGAAFVQKYNKERGGRMQFIPHIEVSPGESDGQLADHIAQQVASGAVALYVWGVSGDTCTQAGAVDRIAKAVELAKKHDLPVGVGGHSLQVAMACEKQGVPCDFYVKTLHRDDYPSATPKEQREDFMWIKGKPGYYDNMWCIDAEETVRFMANVTKPWIAFKVLAAGAILPLQGFSHAFKNGADFIAVGMFDFQVAENCDLVRKVVRREKDRPRPWRA
jgi:hypothetical protein